MKLSSSRQSSNVSDTRPTTVAQSVSQKSWPVNTFSMPVGTGSADGGDMAVQAGINAMASAAAHDAQSTGTFTRKQTLPPKGGMQNGTNKGWNDDPDE